MQVSNTNIEYKGVTYTPEQIATMRDWAKDCQWNDLDDEDIDELSPLVILRGINVHYCGGLSQFLEDSIPVLVSGGNYSNP